MSSLDLVYKIFERGIKGSGKVYVLCPEKYVKIQVTPMMVFLLIITMVRAMDKKVLMVCFETCLQIQKFLLLV